VLEAAPEGLGGDDQRNGGAYERDRESLEQQMDRQCRADDADCGEDEGLLDTEAAADAAAAVAEPPLEPLAPLPGQQLSFTTYDSGLSSEVTRCDDGVYHVRVTGPAGASLVLHWGCNNWELPPAAAIPEGSQQAGDRAVRTKFDAAAGLSAVTLTLPEPVCPERLVFVVHDTEGDVWIRDHSANFSLPLRWVGGWVLVGGWLLVGGWVGAVWALSVVEGGLVCAVLNAIERHPVHWFGGRSRARGAGGARCVSRPAHARHLSTPPHHRAPCLSALVEGVLIAESSYEHWGLLQRLQRVLELLDAAEAAGGCMDFGLHGVTGRGLQQRVGGVFWVLQLLAACTCKRKLALHEKACSIVCSACYTLTATPHPCVHHHRTRAGPSGMAFVYTWLRLSNARLLDWSRSFSYQPKDIAWAQQQVRACMHARVPGTHAAGCSLPRACSPTAMHCMQLSAPTRSLTRRMHACSPHPTPPRHLSNATTTAHTNVNTHRSQRWLPPRRAARRTRACAATRA